MAFYLRGFLSYLLECLSSLITTPASPAKNRFLRGPFAPVKTEEGAVECQVVGSLPKALAGTFARNGPNPQLPPMGGYHWFDGDGMAHSVHVKDGKAYYSNRYVRTVRFEQEKKLGKAVYVKIGDFESRWALLKIYIDKARRCLRTLPLADDKGNKGLGGTANTSLVYHANRLMALHEGDVPYALKIMCDGVIETLGMVTFDGKLHYPFTAHPKIMPDSGYMYAFGYEFQSTPYLTYHVVDPKGETIKSMPIDLPAPVMQHDFAVTTTKAIFMDFPMVFDVKKLFKEANPITFDPTKPARFGVLPLDAASGSEVKWFALPEPIACFHTLNAWDEGNEVHVVLSAYAGINMDFAKNVVTPRSEMPDLVHYTISLETGNVSWKYVCRSEEWGLEFPQLNRDLLGKKNRYGYATVFGTEDAAKGFVKVDLEAPGQGDNLNAVVGMATFGKNKWGGEVVFIPDPTKNGKPKKSATIPEDCGWLATFVVDGDTGASEMVVWDAQNVAAEPVARVKIPARVPLGFHALFVSEEELKRQRPAAAAAAAAVDGVSNGVSNGNGH